MCNITDRGLHLSGVIDRNTLDKSANFVTTGIKIIDYGTICTISKKPINVCYNATEFDSNILIYVRDWYFIMKIIFSQENKASFSEFED